METDVLPLYDIPIMEEGGFEPPNSERAVLQTAAFSHFATPPLADLIIITKIQIKCKTFLKLFSKKSSVWALLFQKLVVLLHPQPRNEGYSSEVVKRDL